MPAPTSIQAKKRRITEYALMVNNGEATPALVPLVLNSSGITLDLRTTDIVTQGTLQAYRDTDVEGMSATVTNDVVEEALFDLTMTAVTTGLAAGIAKQWLFTGLPLAEAYGLRIKTRAILLGSLTPVEHYFYFPKGNITRADPFANFANGGGNIMQSSFIFEAQQTTTDALNAPLTPAVPAPGVYCLVQKLA